jgi:hypothetical protein
MSIVRQPAYITKSPISISVVGGPQIPFPSLAVVPAQDVQVNGVLTGTGRGKWVNAIDYLGFSSATSFAFSDLEGVVGSFLNTFPVSSLTSLSAPNLIYVGGSALTYVGTITFSSLDLSKLQFVGSNLFYAAGPNPTIAGITSVNLSSLVHVGSAFRADFPNATSINLSKLQYVGQVFNIGANALTSLSLPSLIVLNSSFTLVGSLITTLTLTTLLSWKVLNGSFLDATNALNQTSVDNLLAALAYMDGNNGTYLYGTGRAVTIQGTSSTPSNLGSVTTPASQFSGVGTTCTVNWTNHGYANNDVLRISGITTLTAANGYFRITFVNANQFTYTMLSSQTATGVGTATVIKAGPDAKALVTRGVTLTTN